MTNLVNIVHPYSYKMRRNGKGFSLIYGSIEEFEERDRKVIDFLRKSLDFGLVVLRHDLGPRKTIGSALRVGAVHLCGFYGEILFDERVNEITTLIDGLPLLEKLKKPERICDEQWETFNGLFISDSELKRLIGNPDRTFYIGGFFEACVKNMAYHQITHYTPNREVFCIEELCASTNDEKTQEVREGLQRDGVKIITYEEAMNLLREG